MFFTRRNLFDFWLEIACFLYSRFSQWRSQPKTFLGANLFDFRRATVFLFVTPLRKTQND